MCLSCAVNLTIHFSKAAAAYWSFNVTSGCLIHMYAFHVTTQSWGKERNAYMHTERGWQEILKQPHVSQQLCQGKGGKSWQNWHRKWENSSSHLWSKWCWHVRKSIRCRSCAFTATKTAKICIVKHVINIGIVNWWKVNSRIILFLSSLTWRHELPSDYIWLFKSYINCIYLSIYTLKVWTLS